MNDLISKQKVISLPVKPKEDRYFKTKSLDDAYEYGWSDLQGCIEKLPSVQPELTDEDVKLIKQLRSYHNGSYAKVIDKLLAVASAQPEQQWIPVSERLPDLDKYSHGKVWERKVLITGYFSFDDKKELFVSEEFANDVINDNLLDNVIIAWMPLPKPYRAERNEE